MYGVEFLKQVAGILNQFFYLVVALVALEYLYPIVPETPTDLGKSKPDVFNEEASSGSDSSASTDDEFWGDW
jgi:hypothetical protein|eukprot:Stramenopile-MAST_4_protein_4465